MGSITTALSKTRELALGIIAGAASAVVSLGSISAGAATIGAQQAVGQALRASFQRS